MVKERSSSGRTSGGEGRRGAGGGGGRLATLLGSEKQVAWASSIRDTMLADAKGELDKIAERANRLVASGKYTQQQADQGIRAYRSAVSKLGDKGDARWWIDNRNKRVIDIMNTIARGK